jgi:hypothetical protein
MNGGVWLYEAPLLICSMVAPPRAHLAPRPCTPHGPSFARAHRRPRCAGFKGQSSVLKVLKALVKKQPLVLSTELPKVVDVVVRCFDPSLPKIREACFKSAMSVVHEMCPAYPMMSLYRPVNGRFCCVCSVELLEGALLFAISLRGYNVLNMPSPSIFNH